MSIYEAQYSQITKPLRYVVFEVMRSSVVVPEFALQSIDQYMCETCMHTVTAHACTISSLV